MQMGLRDVLKTGAFALVMAAVSTPGLNAFADEPAYGTMAAAIRSANFPCAHVQSVQSAGNNSWLVQCNSGSFRVTRDGDGNYAVTKAD